MRAVLTGILLLVAIADTASARNIFAFQQEGSTDHQKLTNAIAAAEPGDSIYLSKCRERNGEVQCPFPLTWTLDTTVWGKHGVTYVGHSDRGRSTLKMANFGPGDDWDTMRWRDILSFGFQEASSQPTVLRDILFDGNRDHQGAVLNPRCESACPEGWFCQHNWCYHPTCDGCRADEIPCPKTVLVSASHGRRGFCSRREVMSSKISRSNAATSKTTSGSACWYGTVLKPRCVGFRAPTTSTRSSWGDTKTSLSSTFVSGVPTGIEWPSEARSRGP